jgi:hypothetical protein
MNRLSFILSKTVQIKEETTITHTVRTKEEIKIIKISPYNNPQIKKGTHIHHEGNIYEAIKMDPLGWYLLLISGKKKSYQNTPEYPMLYRWDDRVYLGKRFEPLRSQASKNGR